MTIRAFSSAGFVLLACGAALAATRDPPSADQIARVLDLLERGGPAVVALLGALGVAFLAALIALALVLIHLVQAVPRIARPLADAYATLRGGATQREERLRAENATLARELDLLKAQVVGLEHRDRYCLFELSEIWRTSKGKRTFWSGCASTPFLMPGSGSQRTASLGLSIGRGGSRLSTPLSASMARRFSATTITTSCGRWTPSTNRSGTFSPPSPIRFSPTPSKSLNATG